MKFRPTGPSTACAKRACRGFTLAEVLAALAFMAIVIPVAVQGLKVASQAGVVAQRKSEASRVAERLLNEAIVSTNWVTSTLSGKVEEGVLQYRWQVRNDPWLQEPIRLVSVQVQFSVQGQEFDVRLSTLANSLRVALLTPTSVACADSATATSSV